MLDPSQQSIYAVSCTDNAVYKIPLPNGDYTFANPITLSSSNIIAGAINGDQNFQLMCIRLNPDSNFSDIV